MQALQKREKVYQTGSKCHGIKESNEGSQTEEKDMCWGTKYICKKFVSNYNQKSNSKCFSKEGNIWKIG